MAEHRKFLVWSKMALPITIGIIAIAKIIWERGGPALGTEEGTSYLIELLVVFFGAAWITHIIARAYARIKSRRMP